MVLHCPFCNGREDTRIDAIDHSGRKLFLIMFNCPFSFKFYQDEMDADDKLQTRLYDWRKNEGDAWLESLGPVLKSREIRGIELYQKSLKRS